MAITRDTSTPPPCSRQSLVRCANRNFAPMPFLSDPLCHQRVSWFFIAYIAFEVTCEDASE
jgi:hypothetical protein